MNITKFSFFKKKIKEPAIRELKAPDVPGILPILSVNELIAAHAGK